MNELDKYLKFNKAIVEILDELLASNDWESSLFLKVAGKQLQKMRDEAKTLLEKGDKLQLTDKVAKEKSWQKPPLKEGEIELFIALYQAQSSDLEKWEETLLTLNVNSVGRPIYAEESHVIEALKARGNLPQEGYASVYIKESDILDLPESRKTYDRFNHALFSLQEQAVRVENIHEFVQANQKHYAFKKGKLSLINNS